MKKTTIISILVTILVVGGIIWIARPGSQRNTASVSSSMKSNGALTVEETNNYDFGVISMAAGAVKHAFKIKNTSSDAVTIKKIYTSCMCTNAILEKAGKRFGPYGMPGHAFIPSINQTINSGEEAIVETIFNPAAHGPAGIGLIERTVYIENNAGEPIELLFAATVTP